MSSLVFYKGQHCRMIRCCGKLSSDNLLEVWICFVCFYSFAAEKEETPDTVTC